MASYNIQDGQNVGLQLAARALDKVKVDIAVLQEVKIKDAKFATRKWAGYDILTAATRTASCGGIALPVKENEAFTIENEKVVGPNMVSFKMLTGPHKR